MFIFYLNAFRGFTYHPHNHFNKYDITYNNKRFLFVCHYTNRTLPLHELWKEKIHFHTIIYGIQDCNKRLYNLKCTIDESSISFRPVICQFHVCVRHFCVWCNCVPWYLQNQWLDYFFFAVFSSFFHLVTILQQALKRFHEWTIELRWIYEFFFLFCSCYLCCVLEINALPYAFDLSNNGGKNGLFIYTQ